MGAEVHLETLQFRTDGTRQGVEPIVQTVFHKLDAASIVFGTQFVAALTYSDGVLQQCDGEERQNRHQILVFLGGDGSEKIFTAPQDVAVTASLGVFEDIIGGPTIDDEVAVEVGSEDVGGNIVATTGADGVDGDFFGTEDPQPGIDAVDAPAGLVGMNDMGASHRGGGGVVSGQRR